MRLAIIHNNHLSYSDGQPYSMPRGRYAPKQRLEDLLSRPMYAVVDLDRERPTSAHFLDRILRELRIRFYQPKSVKSYGNALRALLSWFGSPPHLLTREAIRQYLETLVDGGAGSSHVSTTLSAIRTALDRI